MPSCSRKTVAIAGISSCILALGITALVLGLMGYFAVKEPCVAMDSFEVVDFNLEYPDDEPSGLLGLLTGGFLPSQATIALQIVIGVNNTNPYGINIKQSGDGTVVIPFDGEGDVQIGTWSIPDSAVAGKSSEEIPVEVVATIDLLGEDAMRLGGDIVAGRPVTFRVEGSIEASGWVHGVTGQINLRCFAVVESIMDLDPEELPSVKCGDGQKMSTESEVDESCLV